MGVDNKYCKLCTRAEKLKTDPRPHDCAANYTGPSTGMESDIIVRGLNYIQDLGVWPKYIVGDGDANVFTNVQRKTPRGRFCEKVECANHSVRNYTKNMHAIAKNTSVEMEGRRLLKPLIPRLTSGARGAIRNNVDHTVDDLRADLWNGPLHVLGEHAQCGAFCSRKDTDEPNNVDVATRTQVLSKVRAALQSLLNNAEKLRLNQTTNDCECFMSLLAKLTGGKRVDLSTGLGYENCCYAAALMFLLGPGWHLVAWTVATGRPLGSVAQQVFTARVAENERLRKARQEAREARERGEWVPRRRFGGAPDAHYGRTQEQKLQESPDVPDDVLQERMDAKIGALCDQVPDEATSMRIALVDTVGQHDNELWKRLRADRVTACSAGDVKSKQPTTARGKLVKSLYYGVNLDHMDHIKDGHAAELVVKREYAEERGTPVVECGIFILPDQPHLGASPDGLVGTDGLIEVKNFSLLGAKTILETFADVATRQKLRSALKFVDPKKWKNKKNITIRRSDVEVNNKSKYYAQVQMQLALSNRKWCDLVLKCDQNKEIFRIYRNRSYWNDELLPALTNFYYDCFLPELVDSRLDRDCDPREPEYVIQAQKKKQHPEEDSESVDDPTF